MDALQGMKARDEKVEWIFNEKLTNKLMETLPPDDKTNTVDAAYIDAFPDYKLQDVTVGTSGAAQDSNVPQCVSIEGAHNFAMNQNLVSQCNYMTPNPMMSRMPALQRIPRQFVNQTVSSTHASLPFSKTVVYPIPLREREDPRIQRLKRSLTIGHSQPQPMYHPNGLKSRTNRRVHFPSGYHPPCLHSQPYLQPLYAQPRPLRLNLPLLQPQYPQSHQQHWLPPVHISPQPRRIRPHNFQVSTLVKKICAVDYMLHAKFLQFDLLGFADLHTS